MGTQDGKGFRACQKGILIYMCLHTYMHTYIHTYIHACIHRGSSSKVLRLTGFRRCNCTFIYIYIYIYICITYTSIYIDIYIYIYIYTYIYNYTTCIHTYKCICICIASAYSAYTYMHTYIRRSPFSMVLRLTSFKRFMGFREMLWCQPGCVQVLKSASGLMRVVIPCAPNALEVHDHE